MQKLECSLQSNRLFGAGFPKWHQLNDEDRHFLNLPNHVSDQVFRVLIAKTPSAHLFEILVSEQCPKDAYSHLGRGLSKLKKLKTAIVNVIHNKSANAHLMMWTETMPHQIYHLDMDFTHLSALDHGVLDCLNRISSNKRERLFQLVRGQSQGQHFFNSLHRHLKQINCKNEQAWHALVDLALKLIFLIFVERKGWLNFDPYYLESKMGFCMNSGLSVIHNFFKPLFGRLEGVEIEERLPLGTLPMLGGGLFAFQSERLPPIPNDWCLALYHSLVSQYSFSLFEAREGRQVIGIGPEMLGQVFENLLIHKDRKATGAYYTPPEVAEKQVHAAFEAWLEAAGPEKASTRRKRLEKVRILDPSCGSGAYLVAAFQVLLKWRLSLTPSHERYNGKLFALKRSIMLENLYGVDINPMAVRLTEVRLWLNMIQDLEISEPSKAPALPNLQHHLRPGDFLGQHLGDHPERMVDWPKFSLLEQLRNRFPTSSAVNRRKNLKHIYRLEWELQQFLEGREWDDAKIMAKSKTSQGVLPGHETQPGDQFVWPRLERSSLHIVFSKVFLEEGFDLVVGNPPWLSAAKITASQKHSILRQLRLPAGLTLGGQVDLSLYFMAASFSILRKGGHLSFLMPGKILQAQYAAGLRAWLQHFTQINYIFDYSIDQNLLFQADTFPLTIGVTRQRPQANNRILVEQKGHDLFRSFQLAQSCLQQNGEVWRLESAGESKPLRAMDHWPRLQDLPFKINRGVVTYSKKHFVFDTSPRYIPQDRFRPLLCGRDIQAGHVTPKKQIYWPFDQGPLWFEGAAAAEKRWLKSTGKISKIGAGVRLKYQPKTMGPWILAWKYLGKKWEATLYRGDWVPDQTTYFMNIDNFEAAWRLFSWLNSEPVTSWVQQIAERGKDRHFFFYAHTCKQAPFPPDLFVRDMKIPKEKNLFTPGEAQPMVSQL